MKRIIAMSGAALSVLSAVAGAQPRAPTDYPNRPVRWIIPFAAGGPTDFVARLLGAKMNDAMGQPIVIDNRDGASGMLGSAIAAKAQPDGYTLLVGSGTSLTSAPALKKTVPYDPFNDFMPICLMVINPQILLSHPTLQIGTVKDLINLAKARPGQLNYGSGGVGATPHLSAELLRSMTGIQIVHVPFKGSGPALTELIAGRLHFTFNSMQSSVMGFIRDGRLKGIAVTSARRSPAAPDIPTVAETLPGYENISWYGLFAPAKTSPAIINQINAQLVKILNDPETAKRLSSQGADPAPGTPAELARYMVVESERLKKLIAFAGIEPD